MWFHVIVKLVVISFNLIFTSTQGINGQSSTKPCQRECDGSIRQCTFNFYVDYRFTMSKACYNCPQNFTDCNRQDCITADGYKRPVVVVNGQLPGPSIQVCEGDQVIVDVKNRLLSEGTSIHWHGLSMDNNPYMDGVPMVTQCPISPGSTFRYNFTAGNPGTHFYYSTTGLQRADGFFGSIIVRQSRQNEPHASQYDYDLPEHVILVTDWRKEMGTVRFVTTLHDGGDETPSSLLVNGKGRVAKLAKDITPYDTVPFATFNVEKGKRYRFRVISNGVMECPIQVSIDNHTMLVIASDGNPVQPIEVDSFVLTAGERYDFVLRADQTVSSYWIRFRGAADLNKRNLFQAAILRYNGAPDSEPLQIISFSNSNRSGRILNPVNIAPGDQKRTAVSELKALYDNKWDWTREPQRQFYLSFDSYSMNLLNFDEVETYPIFGIEQRQRLMISQINRISMQMPSTPLLSSVTALNSMCNDTTMSDCNRKFCSCTHTLHIPLGSLIEVVVVDEGVPYESFHPFHKHGTSFRVVAMQRVNTSITADQVRRMDQNGQIKRNLINAPIKDTVAVPDGGYTIIRFVAKNPGYWMFRCNHAFHASVGMGVIFKVGETSSFPPVPKNFPTCADWLTNYAENPVTSNDNKDCTGSSIANLTSLIGRITFSSLG